LVSRSPPLADILPPHGFLGSLLFIFHESSLPKAIGHPCEYLFFLAKCVLDSHKLWFLFLVLNFFLAALMHILFLSEALPRALRLCLGWRFFDGPFSYPYFWRRFPRSTVALLGALVVHCGFLYRSVPLPQRKLPPTSNDPRSYPLFPILGTVFLTTWPCPRS